MRRPLQCLISLWLLGGCGRLHPAAAAGPDPEPNLLGEWDVTLSSGGSRTLTTQLSIVLVDGVYDATISPPTGAGEPYRSRSVIVDRNRIVIMFRSPNGGDARWDASLRSTNVLEGVFTETTSGPGRLTARRGTARFD